MERDNNIINMYQSGLNATKIAEKLSIGRRTVYRVLEKNNIELHIDKEKKCLICNKICQKNICCLC
jgi:DNA invertase Pin-like site-specific DNA recombinase